MSQRTRGRTTGAASRPTKAVKDVESQVEAPVRRGRGKIEVVTAPAQPVATIETPTDPAAMSPEALARALRAVASELERDPALARRVASAIAGDGDRRSAEKVAPARDEAASEPEIATIGRTFHPSIVTGVAADLGAGVLDPFALRARLGADGLRQTLESLRLGSLRAIVREHKLDPGGRLGKLNDVAKLRERIMQATAKGSK